MYSPRFDRLFSEADANGQFATRADVARAIIDWADADEQMFSPDGVVGLRRGLPLRRPRRPLPRPRQQLRHRRGDQDGARRVSDGFMEAFQPYLTVYASDPTR